MRKEYGAALREAFTKRLASICPFFEPVKNMDSSVLFAGERAYRWVVSARLHNWVIVVPDQKREAFTLELGWSRRGRFPHLTMRPSATRPDNATREDEYVCRLGDLSRGEDVWWTIEELPLNATQKEMMAYLVAQTQPVSAEEARSRVLPHVQAALDEFEHFGLPFLRAHIQPGAAGDAP